MILVNNYWQKLITVGVQEDFDPELKTHIKTLNALAITCGVFSIVNIIWAYVAHLQLLALLDLISLISMGLIVVLNFTRNYVFARFTFFTAITALIFFIDSSMKVGVYFYFFPLIVFAAYLFQNRIMLFIYFVFLLVIYLLIESNIFEHVHINIYTSIEWMSTMKNLTLSFILTFLAVLIFRHQTKHNRNEIIEANERLKKSGTDAAEKAKFAELLLQEMNHRMKNNLQLISSLLNIHATQLDDKQAKEAVLNARMRISSISLIHKPLYKDKLVSTIDLADYVKNLVPFIKESLTYNIDDIHFDVKAEKIEMPMEEAVSVGLIINEALTNSIRHGVKDIENKEIKLEVKRTTDDNVQIVVRDNGVGIQRMKEKENAGFGYELINTLVGNFNGRTVIDDKINQLTIYLNYKSSGFNPPEKTK